MNVMTAIGEHAIGQPLHPPADFAPQRLVEFAYTGARLEGRDLRQ